MLTLRCARQTRAFLFSPSAFNAAVSHLLIASSSSSSSYCSIQPYALSTTDLSGSQSEIRRSEIVNCFREWFMTRKIPLFDRIYEILRTQEEASMDSSLSSLNLYLDESLVLDVLRYDPKDVLSCLKFFDWAGRQPGFHHTRASFDAMFRILSKAKLMSLMLDFLEVFVKQNYARKIRYYNILVIGYAIAGKCETALLMFGRMRFLGVDLDMFSYHVLMNSLVEHGYFDVVEMVANEIRNRGFQNDITHSIMMKSFCKQNKLERASEYLHNLAQDGNGQINGIAVGTYVDALCKQNQFERAGMLIEELRSNGLVPTEHAYGVWIRHLVVAGKLDAALEFLKDKQGIEGYVPEVFRYNMLIGKLLRQNRIEDVFDLLADMKERGIVPDNVTMNSILCLLCKVGKMHIALELFDSRSEFGLSINYMAYNYLINSLVGGVRVDEAYNVMRSSIEHGYIPGPKTLLIVADALCREGRLDEMKDLVSFVIDQNIMPNKMAYDKFVLALCKARRVEEGYMIYDMLKQTKKEFGQGTRNELVKGSIELGKGDIAVRILVDMIENGYMPKRLLFRKTLACLLRMDNPEDKFLQLLEMLLARQQLTPSVIYNFFIDGAGYAGNPELAGHVFEMMKRSGVEPGLRSHILLFFSHLNTGRISSALHIFSEMSTKWNNKKLWRAIVVGLCRIGKPDHASQVMDSMKAKLLKPRVECYEALVKAYCDIKHYEKAIEYVNEMTRMGRPISSFIGNVFLLNALKSRELYYTWAYLSRREHLTPACWMLGHMVGVFSGAIRGVDTEELEQLIGECFLIDTYTINILLRRMSMYGIDNALEYYNKSLEKGYEPNRWTYDIIVHTLAKGGRFEECRKWRDEMLKKGFEVTEATIRLL
ncbi:pentatricopeptide repeat-containing protein At1g71210, mitochondrial [Andrographis paniculata]|uniref:pentatricopeptide repeat-containing protein At1g71210, mitochondrial n=1 Tax=Andrographis paniculata TaxID=175694 RepID=UPI0021E92460|nr:pentatricopeptide repeat-containing protein At1g71210, mitochondrial [Andrographis paniculata]XP_051148531.1 pentatricopeptide repeat-containing protein At1g71210, mitochondrial [Andrographis paniculata]XP_051148532.1 pentatricopeptide repeat-containing protein At1g71210, mitochondrial [Andrographis paniculata]XP_051148533.1 pentatricopeptide repeat-containing protein At1g71210, mitochondrial [Andrographis paniculata]XP_051148534.1 pentatricopeptide repeat-containing protein At1g71210, mitoc